MPDIGVLGVRLDALGLNPSTLGIYPCFHCVGRPVPSFDLFGIRLISFQY